jgi:predicted AAA+ superfamily ATPase
MTAYFKRAVAGSVLKALEDMPVVALTGMRQSGKSTFPRNETELRKRRYVTRLRHQKNNNWGDSF